MTFSQGPKKEVESGYGQKLILIILADFKMTPWF